MVDRYSIAQNPHLITKEKGSWKPIYNAHPTQKLPILHTPDQISYFHWGLMSKWSNNKVMSSKLFNLDVERAFEKTSFRKSLQSRRCVALADGYYVWRQIGKKQHTPYYHYLPQQQLFGIAGIWESSEDLEGNSFDCFMCLMRQSTSPSHTTEEQPIMVLSNDVNEWLNPDLSEESIRELIRKSEEIEVATHAVSPAIRNTENNSSTLTEPAMPADQHGNYTLF
ncbi:MAG: SOS response-associated peptidase family protein [Bacteroidota bacterium]